MFSPSFECSLDGLRSAVRLRFTLWGMTPDQSEARAALYVDNYRLTGAQWWELLRQRIELVIADIEHLTDCDVQKCPDTAHVVPEIREPATPVS